jgi:hypothetical protein
MTNKQRFAELYRANLHRAVTECPQDYAYIAGKVDTVADKMLAAIERGSANKDGYAFKQTCKQLGIPHTYKAINAFLSA